ncbi:MAG: EamA family transporter, partial [Clostridia bacterium]|nr:EamA family transporter [Clostridia bacterium]
SEVIAMKKSTLGAVYIIIAALMWGAFPMFNRILYASGVTVLQAVSARAVIAAAIYAVWGFAAGTFRGLKWRDFAFLFVYGIVSVLGTYTFYALAIRELSGAMASMLLYTAPAFVIIFNRIFYGDRITPIKLAALLISFAGCCLVVRIYDPASLTLNFKGIVYGLLSGISYSLLTVIGRKAYARGYTSLQNTFVPAIAVGLAMCVITPPWTIPFTGGTVILCYLAIGIIGSVLPYFFYLKGLSTGIDGAAAILLANLEPVTATVLGYFIFSDLLEWPQILGIVVVLAGSVLPSLKKSPQKTE